MEKSKTNRQLEAEMEALRITPRGGRRDPPGDQEQRGRCTRRRGTRGAAGFHPPGRGTAIPHPYGDHVRGRPHRGNGRHDPLLQQPSRGIDRTPLNKILGASFHDFVTSRNGQSFEAMLRACGKEGCRGEFFLKTADGGEVPVSLSARSLMLNDIEAFCIVATDLTDQIRAREALEKARDHLEERVAERTAELSQMNARLKEEVAERKRAEEALRLERGEFPVRAREFPGRHLPPERANRPVRIREPVCRDDHRFFIR